MVRASFGGIDKRFTINHLNGIVISKKSSIYDRNNNSFAYRGLRITQEAHRQRCRSTECWTGSALFNTAEGNGTFYIHVSSFIYFLLLLKYVCKRVKIRVLYIIRSGAGQKHFCFLLFYNDSFSILFRIIRKHMN